MHESVIFFILSLLVYLLSRILAEHIYYINFLLENRIEIHSRNCRIKIVMNSYTILITVLKNL